MSEANRELAIRWFDQVWNNGRREAIAEMLNEDAVLHEGEDGAKGPEGFYPFFDRMQAAFSDIRINIEDTLTDGDRVCLRWSCAMTHTGSGFGFPPTNKRVNTTGISIIRVRDGKLLAGWQNWDMLGLMQQIREEPAAPTYLATSMARAQTPS